MIVLSYLGHVALLFRSKSFLEVVVLFRKFVVRFTIKTNFNFCGASRIEKIRNRNFLLNCDDGKSYG